MVSSHAVKELVGAIFDEIGFPLKSFITWLGVGYTLDGVEQAQRDRRRRERLAKAATRWGKIAAQKKQGRKVGTVVRQGLGASLRYSAASRGSPKTIKTFLKKKARASLYGAGAFRSAGLLAALDGHKAEAELENRSLKKVGGKVLGPAGASEYDGKSLAEPGDLGGEALATGGIQRTCQRCLEMLPRIGADDGGSLQVGLKRGRGLHDANGT